MTSPEALLPFFFAMVDATESTFDPDTMCRVDADIFDFNLQHDEGQIPYLDITIKNPYVGLLTPSRPTWCWFSYQSPNGSGIAPLFFGELLGIPSNLFQELITIKYIARPMNYIEAKQAVAETLKVVPNYDPIFLSIEKRDDPDAILEGWSSLYHVDRTSLTVTASDILTGEDGTIVFEENDAFYDSVSLEVGEAPLNNVQVQADVHWTQRCIGYVDGPDVNLQTYTGDTFMSDWPKPGAGLGGGWTVETSFVDDVYQVGLTPMASNNTSWTNTDPESGDCSTQSTSTSASWPALNSPSPLTYLMTQSYKGGVCDPFGDPPDQPPVNTPAAVSLTGLVVPLWVLNCSWTLRYEAHREYSELAIIDILANTQPVLTSPTVEQDTELLKVSGADIGNPLVVYNAWSDYLGAAVGLATIIFPNDPVTPGGLSYQVCIQAGTAGTIEPTFSDVPGIVTDDNTVQWASLGESPMDNIPEMEFGQTLSPGIYIYQQQVFDSNLGTLVETGNASYYLITQTTTIPADYVSVTYIPPTTSNDEATPAPITVNTEQFDPPEGAVYLGNNPPPYLGIPIGGSPDFVVANNYFPSDRGQQSIQYLICKARARIRQRARCIKLSWDCPFDYAVGASCRMNATLYDPRLPGTTATGKIISYSMKGDGTTGVLLGHVEIGVSAGYNGTVEAIEGTPVYVNDGYVNPGYQLYEGATIAVFPTDTNDISYSPPVYAPFDDGLKFPLNSLPSDGGTFSGSLAQQIKAINAAAPISSQLAADPAIFQMPPPASDTATDTGLSPSAAWWLVEQQLYWTTQTIPYVMQANAISWTILVDNVQNGPFSGAYFISTSLLEVPEGMNLAATGA